MLNFAEKALVNTAKITPVILDEAPNLDGTWNVKIRLAHRSKSLYIGTDEYVGARNITKAGDIKTDFIVSNITEVLTHHEVKDLLEKNEADTFKKDNVMFL